MNKILVCLLFVLTVLTSIACVSAVNVDNATSQTDFNVDDIDSNLILDENIDNVSLFTNSSECSVTDLPNDFEPFISIPISIGPTVNTTKPIHMINLTGMHNDIDIDAPKNSKGTLAMLQWKIDKSYEGSTLYIDRNYINSVPNNNITINKNLIIDGQGHTVDFNNYENCFFTSTNGDITIKNLIIKNGYNEEYGSVFYLNNNNGKYIFDNCTFIHCWTEKSGSAIYAKNSSVTIYNSTFEINDNLTTDIPNVKFDMAPIFDSETNTTKPYPLFISPSPDTAKSSIDDINTTGMNNANYTFEPKIGSNILPIVPFIPKNNTTNPILPIPIVPFIPKNNTTNPILPIFLHMTRIFQVEINISTTFFIDTLHF